VIEKVMHGLTGGSWKRSKRQTTDTGKNDLAGNHETTSGPETYRRTTPPRQLSTLHGAFNRSAMYPLLQRINAYLIRWIRNKYKRLRAKTKAFRCWRGIVQRYPHMFAHWKWTASAPAVW
jgi:hypothetical protein